MKVLKVLTVLIRRKKGALLIRAEQWCGLYLPPPKDVCDPRARMRYNGLLRVLSVGSPDHRHCCRLVRQSTTSGLGATSGQHPLLWLTEVLCDGLKGGSGGFPGRGPPQGVSTLRSGISDREHSLRHLAGRLSAFLQRNPSVHRQCSQWTTVSCHSGQVG